MMSMLIGKAIAICEDIGADKWSATEKIEAVRTMASMATHNGVNKQTLLGVIKWMLISQQREWVVCGSQLPDDGQRVLVSIDIDGHEPVQLTECMRDGDEYYTDAGYEWGTEILAWMSLPAPYKREE